MLLVFCFFCHFDWDIYFKSKQLKLAYDVAN